MRGRALAAVAALLVPAALGAQEVRGRVLNAATGAPVPLAELVLPDGRSAGFADASGQFVLRDLPPGPQAVRVRQIGYAFATVTLDRGQAGPVVVQLAPIVLRLADLVASGDACARSATEDAATEGALAAAIAQATANATRYARLLERYPFHATFTTTWQLRRGDGSLAADTLRERLPSSRPAERYRRGRVLVARGREYEIPGFSVRTLGEPEFQRWHCFRYAGTDTTEGVAVLRLDFAPLEAVSTPDWAGTVFLDAATSVLRRVDFALANLARHPALRELRGTIRFRELAPYFAVPDSLEARWWSRRPVSGDSLAFAGEQRVRLDSLAFDRDRPDASGGAGTSPAPPP